MATKAAAGCSNADTLAYDVTKVCGIWSTPSGVPSLFKSNDYTVPSDGWVAFQSEGYTKAPGPKIPPTRKPTRKPTKKP
eukprot:NODE_9260_length_376_cov_98.779817_g8359_i0.p2 GENE.NODE_9260_length_376_cov_98.779817_g8359_i0~~NODE_9260_length_376_cov_98.779817_g8359_i0.p2  ORF type:complete len:79 (-),score=8.96 NODE_9260_length_376_cov_98.779817_g8359_i0:79-315(-)